MQQARDAILKPTCDLVKSADLVKSVLALAVIFLCGQLVLVSPSGHNDSGTVGQIIVLGFLPWLYLAYAALRLFKWASNKQADSQTRLWIWLHLVAAGATLAGEVLLSWALIDSRYMLGAPFGKISELHTAATLALCFGAPFLMGLPACFSFTFTMARHAGAPRAGFMPGLLLSVGLLHPFTLLGATTSGMVLFGGPTTLAAVSSECVWIFSATVGLLLGTLAIESLRVRLARLF